MENLHASCLCPWCCHMRNRKDLLLSVDAGDVVPRMRITLTPFKALILLAVLCSSSLVAAAPVISSLTSTQTSTTQARVQIPTLITSHQQGSAVPVKKGRTSSTQLLSPPKDPDCVATIGNNCTCHPLAKCKRCSRFEQVSMKEVCLFTGYKQEVYCTSKKEDKFISCQYSSNPHEEKKFWGFEAAVLLIAILSLAVVHYRSSMINRQVARRIQRQINA